MLLLVRSGRKVMGDTKMRKCYKWLGGVAVATALLLSFTPGYKVYAAGNGKTTVEKYSEAVDKITQMVQVNRGKGKEAIDIDLQEFRIPVTDAVTLWNDTMKEKTELFDVQNNVLIYKNPSNYVTSFHVSYIQDINYNSYEKKLSKLQAEIDVKKQSMTADELAVWAHEYIVTNCTYDEALYKEATSNPNFRASEDCTAFTSYGALVDGTAVCQGYSGAYKLLMEMCGIECKTITSTSHAWNEIKLNKKWYYVDCTYDDPVGMTDGYVLHTYLLATDSEMKSNHDLSGKYASASDTTYSNAPWKTTYSEMVWNGGSWYYIQAIKNSSGSSYDTICKYTFSSKKQTSMKSITTLWKVGSKYYINSSKLYGDKDYLYYTVPKGIRRIKYNGTGDESVITLKNVGTGLVFGIKNKNGILNYKIATSPSGGTSTVDVTYATGTKTSAYISRGKTGAASYKSSKTTIVKPGTAPKIYTKGFGKTSYTMSTASTSTSLGTKGSIYLNVIPGKVTLSSVAGAGTGKLKISYRAVPGVTGYKIYKATTKTGKYTLVATVKGRTTTSKVVSSKSGSLYYYKVRAYKKSGTKTIYGAYSRILSAKAK